MSARFSSCAKEALTEQTARTTYWQQAGVVAEQERQEGGTLTGKGSAGHVDNRRNNGQHSGMTPEESDKKSKNTYIKFGMNYSVSDRRY